MRQSCNFSFVVVCMKGLLSPPLIDMADQHLPPAKSKGFLNRLKKVFRPPANLSPTVSIEPEEGAKLRQKYTHFRILVIGRANAGKTTLLKRVCNTNEDPVYKMVGYKLSLDTPLLSPLHPQINPTSKVPSFRISLIRSLTLVP